MLGQASAPGGRERERARRLRARIKSLHRGEWWIFGIEENLLMHGSDNFQVLEWITAFLACTGSGFVALRSRLDFPTLFLGNSVLLAYVLSTAHWGFALMGVWLVCCNLTCIIRKVH